MSGRPTVASNRRAAEPERASAARSRTFDRLLDRVGTWSPRAIRGLNLGLVVVLAVGDYLTGAAVAFTALYLLPIASAGWFATRRHSLLLACLCSFSWLMTDILSRSRPVVPGVLLWNFAAQLTVFCTMAILIHGLRLALVEERRALVEEHARALSAQRQLQHAERLLTVGRLAAGVAHELGTPLNVASTYSQMIELGTVAPEEVPNSARIIREQTEAMTRIVRQLVDFARAGKPERRRQSSHNLVAASVSMLGALARKKGVELAARGDEALEVEVDVGQFQQVLTNLVVNAIQAAPARGHVAVSPRRAGPLLPITWVRWRPGSSSSSGSRTMGRGSTRRSCLTYSSHSSPPSLSARAPGSGLQSRTASFTSTRAGSLRRTLTPEEPASASIFRRAEPRLPAPRPEPAA